MAVIQYILYALFSYTIRFAVVIRMQSYNCTCGFVWTVGGWDVSNFLSEIPWWFCWQEKWRKTWRSSCRSKAWRESWKRWRWRLTLDWWSAAMSWTSPMPHAAKHVLSRLMSKRPAIFSMGASDMSGYRVEYMVFTSTHISLPDVRCPSIVFWHYSDNIFQLSLHQKVHSV